MNAATVVAQASAAGRTEQSSVRRFNYRASQSELDDLRRRILATRLPERETEPGQSSGVPLATVERLKDYWGRIHDWRNVEARINALPNFMTEIDGLGIHFIHVRSKHENALPVLVAHGWPGSIIHKLKIIDPLVKPTAHGGNTSDAFHVVIPSMPGYGFSGKPTSPGWGPDRIGRAWITLMKRLGYTKFVAQGGDWGAIIVELMAIEGDPALIGIHTNMPGVVPSELDPVLRGTGPLPDGLTAEERDAGERLQHTWQNIYYAFYQASRPQTLTALSDSPVGLATWMIDFDPRGLELIVRAFDGQPTSPTRDEILDNITLFWLTNTAVSAARLYRENKFNFFTPKKVTIPVAVSVFPDELYQAPKSWAERAFAKLIHYNRLHAGGHFPAWEQPKLFVEELRTGLKSLR